MVDHQPQRFSEAQARAAARAFIDRRHTDALKLVRLLLRYTPEADQTQALRQLSTGELRRLAQLLADATDLREVAPGYRGRPAARPRRWWDDERTVTPGPTQARRPLRLVRHLSATDGP